MGSKKGDRERRDQNEKMKNGFGKIADPMRERERKKGGRTKFDAVRANYRLVLGEGKERGGEIGRAHV